MTPHPETDGHGEPRPGGHRGGFTLVELAMVVLIIALLAAIGLPNFQRAVVRARATEAIAELQVIRVAVMGYLGEHHQYPADVNRGQVPDGLGPYLPEGYTFTTEYYTIDYDNWSGKDPGFVGLSVITTDAEIGAMMIDILGDNAWSNGSDRFTWVVDWTN